MKKLKNFSQFIGEALDPEEATALRELERMGLLGPEDSIRLIAAELSELFGVELVEVYNYYTDDQTATEPGGGMDQFVDAALFAPARGYLAKAAVDLAGVQIWPDGLVLFLEEGSPYFTRHNTQAQRDSTEGLMDWEMADLDNKDFAVNWKNLDREDWDNYIDYLENSTLA